MSGELTDGGKMRIHTLKAKWPNSCTWSAETNADKSRALQEAFFLEPVAGRVQQHGYPAPKFEYEPVTNIQIQCAISWLGPYKVAGPDGIANIVFIRCANLLVPHLGPIYRATFSLGTYPKQWKDLVTVVLRKPMKPDYMLLSTHQLIELLNTMAKILSVCVTEDLVHMAKMHRLLPKNHFECRPGRTMMDSLHYVTKYMKDAWRRNVVVSALFLDVKSTFPSMVLEQLTHDMRQWGVPATYTDGLHKKWKAKQQPWPLMVLSWSQSSCKEALIRGAHSQVFFFSSITQS